MSTSPAEQVVCITHLRECLGVAYLHVATTHEPIVMQRYKAQDVMLVPAWRGRGACRVIKDVEATGSMDACDVEVAFVSVVFHELAHILTRSRMWVDRDRIDATALASEAVAMGQQVAEPEPSLSMLIPF